MIEDDWMNPKTVGAYIHREHPDGTFYLISRKKRIPVTGNVSHIEQWATWQEFDDKAKRDAELKRLRGETEWVLRADQVIYLHGRVLPGSNPRDMMDV
jgi:hypothetical protein